MAKAFFTGRNVPIQLGRELGRGGEGSVFEVPTLAGLVAKIYHKTPEPKKQAKLRFMAASANDALLAYASWPQDTLHTSKAGPITGFLMPKVQDKAPIHMLYSPAHRKQEYPKAAWDFLLFAARNTAAAFETLHRHGHVLGDVNQGNVMVGRDSKVMLIDSDSYQINANGTIHLCEVGVSHFTPPELQGISSFDGVKRNFNHDNFGLALILFHLLFGGRHPYAGKPLRKDVGEALETDIKAFRFAYGRDAASRGIAPPPNSISLELVPDHVQAMFALAFTEVGAKGGRPTSSQWLSALDTLRTKLKKCGQTPMHIYPDHLANCPWCMLDNTGVVYFLDWGQTFAATASGFVLSKVWTIVESITPPSLPALPTSANFSPTPSPLPSGVGDAWGKGLTKGIIVALALACMVAAPKAFFGILIAAWIAWSLVGSSDDSAKRAETRKRQDALDKARQDYDDLHRQIRAQAGPEGFQVKKQELIKLKAEYEGLAEKERMELMKLHSNAQERQRHQYLDRFFIDGANIPGVGLAKKAALRSFGIETAADVTAHKVRAVKGFGDLLTRAMVDWRKSCERNFVFNPALAVPVVDRNKVTALVAARRRAIEAALLAGPEELQRYKQQMAMHVNRLLPAISAAAHKLAQAEADRALL